MATVVGDLLVKLSASDDQLTATLASAGQKMQAFGDKMKAVGQSMTMFVTAPLVLAGGASIKLASDLSESMNKVDVAFKGSAQNIKDWSKTTINSFGIAQGTALDMASLYGDMATSMGFSTKAAADMSKGMVGLAGDLASFKNIGLEEANTALKGVFTNQSEALTSLGIVMTEDNIKAYALAQGITKAYKEMSQAEKVTLRYQYVLENTKNAQGDFARTSDGAANQSRMFGERMKELGASFGAIILPLFTKIITAVNGWIDKFKGLDEGTKKIILVVAGLAAVIGPLFLAIGFFSSTVLPALIAGGLAFSAAWLPLTAIILGVAAAWKIFSSTAKDAKSRMDDMSAGGDKDVSALEAKSAKIKKLLEDFETFRTNASKPVGMKVDLSKIEDPVARFAALADEFKIKAGFGKDMIQILREEKAATDTVIFEYQKRKKAAEEAELAAKDAVIEEQKKLVVTQQTIGIINNLEKEITDLGVKQKAALDPADVKKYGDKIEELQHRIERVNKGLPAVGREGDTSMSTPIKGLPAKVEIPVSFVPKVDMTAFEEAKTAVIDIGAAMTALAASAAVTLGESIGNALSGGGGLQSVLDNMLNMLADWAAQFGATLIAAGTASLIAQQSLASNPALAIGAGIVLAAAAAAVKASASKPAIGGASRGSSGTGGGGSTGNLEGFRTMREDFVVNVNGTLTGKGSDLVAVLNKEGVRKTL